MSKDFCMDCGMLLSPRTSICSVCGFDNTVGVDGAHDDYAGLPYELDHMGQMFEMNDALVPENYPGY